jgi:uncharacterized protein
MNGRRVVIAGGTGFIGNRLVKELHRLGYECVVLSRRPSEHELAEVVVWDARTLGSWKERLEGAYAIINLAGESISQKWSQEARERIIGSRLDSVKVLCAAMISQANPPKRWINASAIGYYGNQPSTQCLSESAPLGMGFLADTCRQWEAAVTNCNEFRGFRSRVRIGMVLGEGGALPVLAKLAKFGLGGAAGKGNQPISWIHVEDLVSLFTWLLDQANPPTVINAVAPKSTENHLFMSSLRSVLGVPLGLPAPDFGIQLVGKLIGPDADLILGGASVIPKVAMEKGFAHKFKELVPALQEILKHQP